LPLPIFLPKLNFAVYDPYQRGIDDSLLLRARYSQLIQALLRTREHNPSTLAALRQILPNSDLPNGSVEKQPRPDSVLLKHKDRGNGRIAA